MMMNRTSFEPRVSVEDVDLFRDVIRKMGFGAKVDEVQQIVPDNRDSSRKDRESINRERTNLDARIKSYLCADSGVSARGYFYNLKRTFGFYITANNEKDALFYRTAHSLFLIMDNDEKFEILCSHNLETALNILVEKIRVQKQYGNDTFFCNPQGRVKAVGSALSRLREQLGFCYKIDNGNIVAEKEALRSVTASLYNKIVRIGGLNFIREIFRNLGTKYDSELQMYLFPANNDDLETRSTPSIPWGFLLNVSARCIQSNPQSVQVEKNAFLQCLCLSSDIVAVLDTESYLTWDTRNRTGMGVVHMIRELALYDSNFKIPQVRLSSLPYILRGLYRWTDEYKDRTFPFGYTEIQIFASILTKLIKGKGKSRKRRNEPIVIPASCLRENCEKKIDTTVLCGILDHFIHSDNPNADFLSPEETENITVHKKPIIRINNDYLLIISEAFCAFAFIEATSTFFRERIDTFDSRLGKEGLEEMVRDVFVRKNIEVKYGRYKNANREVREIDIAVESNDKILLVEIKKKPLTQKSKGGDPAELLIDVQQSLIDSQIQALCHEVTLRRDGKIVFNNDSVLEFKNREIEKFSLVLNDFGSLQHRTIVEQLLELYNNYKFDIDTNDIYVKKRFQELENKCYRLNALNTERLSYIDSSIKLPPFFGSWFLNLNQFLFLMENIRSAADFIEAIWSVRRVSFGTLDFLYEFQRMKQMKRVATGKTLRRWQK